MKQSMSANWYYGCVAKQAKPVISMKAGGNTLLAPLLFLQGYPPRTSLRRREGVTALATWLRYRLPEQCGYIH